MHASRRGRDEAAQPISVRGFHGASFVGSLFRTRLCLAYRVVMDVACYVLHVRTCCACVALCGSVVVGVSCVCLGAFCVPLRFRPVCEFVCVRRAYLNVTGGQGRKENGISAAESLEMASAAVPALAFHEKRCSSRFDTWFLSPCRSFRSCRMSLPAWFWAHAYFSEVSLPHQQSPKTECLGYPAVFTCRPFHSIEMAVSLSPSHCSLTRPSPRGGLRWRTSSAFRAAVLR